MISELNYVNSKLYGKETETPQFLYKYRPFDNYTFEMLEQGYVYLCPAEKLDDPSECLAECKIQDLYDFKSGRLKVLCVDLILDTIKPYTSEDNFRQAKHLVYRTLTPNGLIRRNYLLEKSGEIQDLIPGTNIAPLINFLANIPERLDEPPIKEQLGNILKLTYNARKYMGICSFSELSDSKELWNNYADEEKGYCIKYDLRGYLQSDLLYPVVYSDKRETNIVKNMIASFIGQMVTGMSYEQIIADRSQLMLMFLTKDTQWAYQKEWRLLGDAGQQLTAPKINSIILGRNMFEEDKAKMISYCQKYNFVVNFK